MHKLDRYYHCNREKTWLKIRTSTLANLFGVPKYTVLRWIRLGKLNPKSLEDIIDKFTNRGLLDGRMSHHPGRKDNDIE